MHDVGREQLECNKLPNTAVYRDWVEFVSSHLSVYLSKNLNFCLELLILIPGKGDTTDRTREGRLTILHSNTCHYLHVQNV